MAYLEAFAWIVVVLFQFSLHQMIAKRNRERRGGLESERRDEELSVSASCASIASIAGLSESSHKISKEHRTKYKKDIPKSTAKTILAPRFQRRV